MGHEQSMWARKRENGGERDSHSTLNSCRHAEEGVMWMMMHL